MVGRPDACELMRTYGSFPGFPATARGAEPGL